jgi:glycine C-acetyltransferase
MALIGAFVSGDEKVIKFLRYNMRSQIYAKSMPMPLVVGALKRLQLLREQPQLRENLWNIVNTLQHGLRSRGFDIGITQSPVTPVYLKGGTEEAAKLIIDLRENHRIFVSVVTYPVVERGELMLRIIPTAVHSPEDVEITLNAFEAIRDNMNKGVYSGKIISQ